MKNQITLNIAHIALCAVETVLRKTSPGAADYPQLVEQYIDAVSAYRQAVANAENAMKLQTGHCTLVSTVHFPCDLLSSV